MSGRMSWPERAGVGRGRQGNGVAGGSEAEPGRDGGDRRGVLLGRVFRAAVGAVEKLPHGLQDRALAAVSRAVGRPAA